MMDHVFVDVDRARLAVGSAVVRQARCKAAVDRWVQIEIANRLVAREARLAARVSDEEVVFRHLKRRGIAAVQSEFQRVKPVAQVRADGRDQKTNLLPRYAGRGDVGERLEVDLLA